MPMPGLDLNVETSLWDRLPEAEAILRKALAAVDGELSLGRVDEICVTLTDDRKIAELNARWRGKAKPTNVLSFPAPPSPMPGVPRHLGDVVLAFETVESEARAQAKPIGDHVAHLMVHGTLHLLGYDHEGDDEAETMEALEVRILAKLGIADPYAVGVD